MQHLAELRSLTPGTALIARYRCYAHFGIYVGNGRVIHYAGRLKYTGGLVEEVSLAEFSEGRPVFLKGDMGAHPDPERVVRRARSRLRERAYDLLRNNCEHFCNWCQGGDARSAQVERLSHSQRLLVHGTELLLVAAVRAARFADRIAGSAAAVLKGRQPTQQPTS